MQVPWQQPAASLQPSHAHIRPSSWRSTVGDLRIDRLAATASVTSGGSVVSCRHSLKRSERARKASYSVRQCATSAPRLAKRPAYQARK